MRIAVIKLGALGDFAQALSPFRSIRAFHADDHITLITTEPYAALAKATGYFDEIWTDGRARSLWAQIAFVRRFRRARFRRVYDLQTSTRTAAYFHLSFPRRPEWSGVVAGASHRLADADWKGRHASDVRAEQLALAGVAPLLPADLSFVKADIGRFGLAAQFAVLVPGGSAHRPAKRWPAKHYGALAQHLSGLGIQPAILGARAEQALAQEIRAVCPGAADLTDKTDFQDLIALGRTARLAVGNDTGPMHLLAMAGAPTLVLFSAESDPLRCAPRGPSVRTVRVADLSGLSVNDVIAALPPSG